MVFPDSISVQCETNSLIFGCYLAGSNWLFICSFIREFLYFSRSEFVLLPNGWKGNPIAFADRFLVCEQVLQKNGKEKMYGICRQVKTFAAVRTLDSDLVIYNVKSEFTFERYTTRTRGEPTEDNDFTYTGESQTARLARTQQHRRPHLCMGGQCNVM